MKINFALYLTFYTFARCWLVLYRPTGSIAYIINLTLLINQTINYEKKNATLLSINAHVPLDGRKCAGVGR